jgi:UrcA family protein
MFKNKHYRSANLAILGAAMLTILPALTWSDTLDGDARSLKVSAVGINVNSDAGAKALYTRLSEAAKSVCGLAYSGDAIWGANFNSCYDATMNNAVHAVNRPLLTKLLKEKHDSLTVPANGTAILASK